MVRTPALWRQFCLELMRSEQKQIVRNLTTTLLSASVRAAGSALKTGNRKKVSRPERATISPVSRKVVKAAESEQAKGRSRRNRSSRPQGGQEGKRDPAHPLPLQEAQRAGRVRSDDPIARRASQVIMKTPVSDDWRSFLRARAAPTSPVSRPKMLPAPAQCRDARSGHAHAAQAVIG